MPEFTQQEASSGRQLAAIMFTDIFGYTALLAADEEKALDTLYKSRVLQKEAVESHNGKWLKEMADGSMAQFNSALEAVLCALEIQKLAQAKLTAKIRIGIHLGDVTVENGDIFGDGVNIASRLQMVADPGGIYLSKSVQGAISSRKEIDAKFIGEILLKNVADPIKTYYLREDWLPIPSDNKIKELASAATQKNKFLKSPYSLIIIVVILGLIFSINRWWLPQEINDGIRLAVLPVENLSGNEDGEFFVGEIQATLINEIGMISALQVISRTSSSIYRDVEKTIPEIARELNIDMVVECELTQIDDRVQLQFRLIQAFPEEQQLWQKGYDEATRNVLKIYDDVALEISRVINIDLTSQEKTRLTSAQEVNPNAYRAYLKSQFHYNNFTREDFTLGLKSLDLALQHDPNYLNAYLGIAQMWIGRAQMGLVPYSEAYPNIKAAEKKVLAFNIESAEMYSIIATIRAYEEWNWEQGIIAFEKAIAINPNYSDSRTAYSYTLAIMNYHDEAKNQLDLAVEVDPFNPLIESFYGWNMLYADNYKEAIVHCQKSLTMAPKMWVAQDALRQAYHMLGMFEEALAVAVDLYRDKKVTEVVEALALGYNQGGYQTAMSYAAEALVIRSKTTFVSPESIAEMYAYAGKKNNALEWLEIAYEAHDPEMHYLVVAPIYDILRAEPRFQELVRKVNVPQNPDSEL